MSRSRVRSLIRGALVGLVTLSIVWSASAGALAQTSGPIALHVTAADRAAAAQARMRYHITPAHTPAGARAQLNGPEPFVLDLGPDSLMARPALTKVPKPGFYPADLTLIASLFGGGLAGNVVPSAVMQNVYLGCSDGSCWGDPLGFEQDLVKSNFMHVVDKYVGTTAKNRYSVGAELTPGSVASNCTSSSFCSENDIVAIALVASASGGTGKGHLYHIFLPQGVDTCFAGNEQCYSPDDPSHFAFCGYHSAVISGPDTIYFTVEPFQQVPGCEVVTPSPNGQLADSTNSVLSHEIFEEFTDPDLGSGWLAINSLNELGFEIGDECQGPPTQAGDAIVPTFKINGHQYEIQLEYSNKYHACAAKP